MAKSSKKRKSVSDLHSEFNRLDVGTTHLTHPATGRKLSTKSGKRVMGAFVHPEHDNFTSQDHREAANHHETRLKEIMKVRRTLGRGARTFPRYGYKYNSKEKMYSPPKAGSEEYGAALGMAKRIKSVETAFDFHRKQGQLHTTQANNIDQSQISGGEVERADPLIYEPYFGGGREWGSPESPLTLGVEDHHEPKPLAPKSKNTNPALDYPKKGVSGILHPIQDTRAQEIKEENKKKLNKYEGRLEDFMYQSQLQRWVEPQTQKPPRHVASVAVFNSHDELLFGKRKDNGKWTLPGGGFEKGEKPEVAAHRELKEETGFDIGTLEYLGKEVLHNANSLMTIHCFKTYTDAVDDPTSDPDEEVYGWIWIDVSQGLPDEILKNLHSKKNVTLKFLGLIDYDIKKARPLATFPKMGEGKKHYTVGYRDEKYTEGAVNRLFGGKIAQSPTKGMMAGKMDKDKPLPYKQRAVGAGLNTKYGADLGTKQHEEQHGIFQRIGERFGAETRKKLAGHLIDSIPKEHSDLFHQIAQMAPSVTSAHPDLRNEEKIAFLHTYLHSPSYRKGVHSSWENRGVNKRDLDKNLKAVFNHVVNTAKGIKKEDLGEKFGKVESFDDLDFEDLEKGLHPPRGKGETTGDNESVFHGGQWVWQKNSRIRKGSDQFLQKVKGAYLGGIKDEKHRKLVDQFFSKVMTSPARHFVTSQDRRGGPTMPRQRHLEKLLFGRGETKITPAGDGKLHFTTERHGGDRSQQHTWSFDPYKGIQFLGSKNVDFNPKAAEKSFNYNQLRDKFLFDNKLGPSTMVLRSSEKDGATKSDISAGIRNSSNLLPRERKRLTKVSQPEAPHSGLDDGRSLSILPPVRPGRSDDSRRNQSLSDEIHSITTEPLSKYVFPGLRSKIGHGWISPEGEFHDIDDSDGHDDFRVPNKSGRVGGGITPDRKKGWISVGHGGGANLKIHPNILKQPNHPAMATAREMAEDAGDKLFVNDKSVHPGHFAKHGRVVTEDSPSFYRAEDESGSDVPFQVPGYMTQRGKEIMPNESIKTKTQSKFDPKKGMLHTPKGSFKIHIPEDKEFHQAINSPDIQQAWNSAMKHFMPIRELHEKGEKLPGELVANGAAFSILSANTPVNEQEKIFQTMRDLSSKKGFDWRDKEFGEWAGSPEGHDEIKAVDPSFGNLGSHLPRLAKLPEAHGYLTDLMHKHGGDGKTIVDTMMSDKIKHEAAKQSYKTRTKTQLKKPAGERKEITPPEPHAMAIGAGLANKTGRYLTGMLGHGDVVVPDRHFIRHLFNLDSQIDSDRSTHEHLTDVLVNTYGNHKIMHQIDDYYRKNHPAVKFAQNKLFGGKDHKDATFPGFWLHWLSIPVHEKLQDIGKPSAARNLSDHAPFWDAAKEILGKHGLGHYMKKDEGNEEKPSPIRVAAAMHELHDKLGAAPASMLYYSHIVPKLTGKEKIPTEIGKPTETEAGIELRDEFLDSVEKSEPEDKGLHVATGDHGAAFLHPESETFTNPGPPNWKPSSVDITREDSHVMVPTSMLRDPAHLDNTPVRTKENIEEDQIRTPEGLQATEDSVKEHGFSSKGAKDFKLSVGVLRNGKIELTDGTHRAYIANKLGINYVPATVRYFAHSDLNHGLLHAEEPIEKNIKKLIASGMAAAAITMSPTQLPEQTPTPQVSKPAPLAAVQAQVKRAEAPEKKYTDIGGHPHDKFLESISHIESSGGKDLDHPKLKYGLHAGDKAIGAHALMPKTVQYVARVAKHPEVKALKGLGSNEITEKLSGDQPLAHEVAREYATRLHTRFKGDTNRMAYSWLHGHNHKANDAKVKSHDYVQKFNEHFGGELEKQEGEAKKPIPPHSDADFQHHLDHGAGHIAFDHDRPMTPERIHLGLQSDKRSVQMRAMSHPQAKAEHIDVALKSDDWALRADAISHPSATSAHIEQALGDKHHTVREYAIKNPNATLKHIETGLKDSEQDVRTAAFNHGKMTKEMLSDHIERAAGEERPSLGLGQDAGYITGSPAFDKDHLSQLLDTGSPYTTKQALTYGKPYMTKDHMSHILTNLTDEGHAPSRLYAMDKFPHLMTPEHVDILLGDPNVRVRSLAIEKGPVEEHHLQSAMSSNQPMGVRQRAAAHEKATPEVLDRALGDEYHDVRHAALKNPNTTSDQTYGVIQKEVENFDVNSSPSLISAALTSPNINEKHIRLAEEAAKKDQGTEDRPVDLWVGAIEKGIETAKAIHLPDEVHDERVSVSMGSEPYRAYRTAVEEAGGKIHKKDFDKQDINQQHVSKLLDSKGHLTEEALSGHIESMDKTHFNVSHTEWEGRTGMDEDDETQARDDALVEMHDEYLTQHKEDAREGFDEYVDSIKEDAMHEFENTHLPEFHEQMTDTYDEDWKEWQDQHSNAEPSDQNWLDYLERVHSETTPDFDTYFEEHGGEPDFDSYYTELADDPQEIGEFYESNTDEVDERVRESGDYGEAGAPDPNVQTHSNEDQKVMQFNITNEHVNQMKSDGTFSTFKNVLDASNRSGHPTKENTLGWVRYTEGDDGSHIDEIQSDFASDLESTLRRQIKEAKAAGQLTEEQGESAYKQGMEKWPTDHLQKIKEALFGKNKPEATLHEAFHEYKRTYDPDHVGKDIHINSSDVKSKLAGMTEGKDVPVWMKRIYEQHPKKMGYDEGSYGDLDTQGNDYHHGSRTWQTALHKEELDFATLLEDIEMRDHAIGEEAELEHAVKQIWPMQLPTIFEAARVMAGADKVPADHAMYSFHFYENSDEAALHCYGIPVTDQNIKELHVICSVMCANKNTEPMEKTEDAGSILAVVEEDLVAGVNRGLATGKTSRIINPSNQEEKALVVLDSETESKFVVKPGVHGVEGDTPKAIREAVFYQLAQSVGLEEYVEHVGLAQDVNHTPLSIIHLLPRDYRSLEEKRQEDPNSVRYFFTKPLRDGTLFKWAVLDYLAANPHRHAAHIMVHETENKICLISNGEAFSESFQSGSGSTFVPYYLRLWGLKHKMAPSERRDAMPQVHPEVGETLQEWVQELDSQQIYEAIAEIDSDMAQAAVNRLKNLQAILKESSDPIYDINALWWAGDKNEEVRRTPDQE